jgi:hypothetical protein
LPPISNPRALRLSLSEIACLGASLAHDVFICHSSKDKLVADAACNVLEANGIRCWMAPRDVLPGVPYAEGILKAISEARVFLIVFSSHANASNQVSKEVERAVYRGIPILPLRIEDVVPTRSLEYFISESHWLDAITPPLHRHLERLAEVIHRLLGNESEAPASGPASTQTLTHVKGATKSWRLPLATVVAALLVVSIGLGFWFTTTRKAVDEASSAALTDSAVVDARVAGETTPGASRPSATTAPPKIDDTDLDTTSVKDEYRLGRFFTTQRDVSCDSRGEVGASAGPSLPIYIRNRSGQPLRVYWIGSDRKEQPAGPLADTPFSALTGADTPYLVTDESDRCIRIFRATKKYSHFTFTSTGAVPLH